MDRYWNTPWMIWNEIRRVCALPWIRLYFALNGIPWGKSWRVLGTPIIQKARGSRISLGDRLVLRSWVTANPVAPYHRVFLSTRTAGAAISIGDDCGITGGSIIAAERIEIGSRTLIGGNCLITDTDFHPLERTARLEQPRKAVSDPVTIGSDVFIGTQVLVLKGSRIGEGSVIGAGSVVSGHIPANVIAAGNPAVVIKQI